VSDFSERLGPHSGDKAALHKGLCKCDPDLPFPRDSHGRHDAINPPFKECGICASHFNSTNLHRPAEFLSDHPASSGSMRRSDRPV